VIQSARANVRQRLRPWRWTLQAAGIGLVGIFLLVLVFVGPTETFCSSHKTGCGLVTGFISTTLVAIAGYFFIVVWSLRRAVPEYLDLAIRTPERLLPTAGRIRLDDVIRRRRLSDAIITELQPSRRGAPVLLVGAAGTGKTTFLLELTSRLAEAHAVPVVCSLRSADPPLRLREMAKKQFIDAIDPLVRSAEHAERIWRRLCADGEIVVIADGLDEFMPGRSSPDRDHAIRQALTSARNDRLPVVVTSRPETLPIGAHVSSFELDLLPEEGTVAFLEERIPARSRPDSTVLRELANLGRASPYYLEVIAGLLRAQSLTSVRASSRDELLVKLLDGWVELVVEQRLVREIEIDYISRGAIIDGLGAIAYAMTTRCALESDVKDLLDTAALAGTESPLGVLDGASRLQLLETFDLQQSTGLRFTHAISQAYFLSRRLRDCSDAWPELIKGEPSAEMSSALVMWCARDGDSERATAVGGAIIARAHELDADRALLMLVTAAEIASVVGLEDFAALEGAGKWEAWHRASPRAQLAAIRRLRRRKDAWNLRTLMERTRDKQHYRVRWSAAQALAAAGEATWRVLGPEFAQTVSAAAARDDWSDPKRRNETHDISVACWILPALASRLAEPDRTAAANLVTTLADLVPNLPAGTEASLAQGFKLDALKNGVGPVATTVWTLLDRADFWYSRINLAHAVCIRTIADRGANPDAIDRLSELARHDRHPFAGAAADLCVRALRAGDRTPWVWDDEIAIISRSGSMLDDDAARLLADMMLLLNLTEQGDPAEDEARELRKEDIYRRAGLPLCLSASRARDEIFDGCPSERCDFNLCPYPATADRALARNEFSEAFCRHQSEIAGRRVSLRGRLFRRQPARWSSTTGRAAAAFWERMETRVS
jgi:NACHT domain